MNFVLDASVTLAWGFEDESSVFAIAVLQALRTSEAIAASHWPLEVANGLLTAERRGRIQHADAQQFASLVLSLPIVIDPVARSRAFNAVHQIARKYSLAAYDAAYLELAVRLDLPLATLDGPLLTAAKDEGVLPFQP